MRNAILLALLAGACETVPPAPARERAEERAIVVCGEAIAIGAPVVRWSEPPYYDAYRCEPRFDGDAALAPRGLHYRPGRAIKLADGGSITLVEPDGHDLAALQRVVDLLVLHYDACGTSEACFRVLHDQRGLSVHFLLDVDGTIYQTLDLRDQAWHATAANARSIGIEIAHVGAYPPGQRSPLDDWYGADAAGTRLSPERLHRSDRAFRPARPGRIRGQVHGGLYEQPDFTPEQYRSLVELTVALCTLFPLLAAEAPRDGDGQVRKDALDADAFASFHGILGHSHVTRRKIDPGPAFDWEGFLAEVRAALAARRRAPAAP
ncbi:MAG: peptidoglycan recognition family protein [Planctomycetota bacterium]